MTAGVRFAFEPFELDPDRRRLTASGEPVTVSDRQLDVLLMLVVRAGQIVAKDDLLQAGWGDVAVGDNSLEQAISILRRVLGPDRIETVARRGYRFRSEVTRRAARESDDSLDALLAPYRKFLEGRSALETLAGSEVARARVVFEDALRIAPEHASAHIGLANACIMQFETTRADMAPDVGVLALAAQHAQEACRLEPQSAEAWATRGFVLDRTGARLDARAAAKRAVTLEPDNWRHHFRLAYISWGEERLGAAHRTLALLPGFPLAHWLAATVYVARQTLVEAERELLAGLASDVAHQSGGVRYSAVALQWLLGLIRLARGDEAQALASFEAELSLEQGGHLYARECTANTWYAIGVLRLRQERVSEAADAFESAIERVSAHPMARLGLAVAERGLAKTGAAPPQLRAPDGRAAFDLALVHGAQLVAQGSHTDAARLIGQALSVADAGNQGWLLPLEPLLNIAARPALWTSTLALLRNRAA